MTHHVQPNPADSPTGASGSADLVGYRHPPKHSQSQPGQSGNPGGRPKRRRSIRTDLAAALDAPEPGGSGKSAQQLIVEYLVADATARKAFALKMIVPLAFALEDDGKGEDAETVTAREQELVEQFSRREQSADPAPSMKGDSE
jgi:hypothetical protein